MATTDVTQKSRIYHTLSELNTAFAAVVGHCDTLQQTGLFKSKASKLLPSFVQELQAECNQEFLETIEALELEDWNRLGKVRQKWESTSETPMTFSFMRKNAEKNWPCTVKRKRADRKIIPASNRPALKRRVCYLVMPWQNSAIKVREIAG